MSDDLVKQCIKELQDLVECRCHDAYKGRGLHDPTCCCDYAEALKTVADRIEELEAERDALAEKLEKAVEALERLAAHSEDDADLNEWGSMGVARTTLASLRETPHD